MDWLLSQDCPTFSYYYGLVTLRNEDGLPYLGFLGNDMAP